MPRIEGHGGDLIAETLRAHAIDRIFTLSGGHIFPVFDGLHTRDMRIIDTRHEQAAAFAAEAHGKLARVPGVIDELRQTCRLDLAPDRQRIGKRSWAPRS